jgi:DNA-binding NarL/FixJ family response regulator
MDASERAGVGPDRIRILIADDHPLIRQALRAALEKQLDFDVVGEARDGEEVVELTLEYSPDIVIMDIGMPKRNGIEATAEIKSQCPRVAVLILTVHQDPEYVTKMMQAGASGYLTKSVFDDQVVSAVRTIVSGGTVLSPSVVETLWPTGTRTDKPAHSEVVDILTTRQLQILQLLAEGKSNKEIARLLLLGLGTVKVHLSTIFMKLNARSRTEAITIALRKGLLGPGYLDQH